MTEKDYKSITKIISEGALDINKWTLIDDLVAVFKEDNDKFGEAKFRKACE